MDDQNETNVIAINALAPMTAAAPVADDAIAKPKRKYKRRKKRALKHRNSVSRAGDTAPIVIAPEVSAPTLGSAPAAPETAGDHHSARDPATRFVASLFRARRPLPATLDEDGALLIEPDYSTSPRFIVALGMAGTAAIIVGGWVLAWYAW